MLQLSRAEARFFIIIFIFINIIFIKLIILKHIHKILTGWTVGIDKLSQTNSLFVRLFDQLNTTRCGKLLYVVKNTYSIAWDSYLDNVRMSIYHPLFKNITIWVGQSAWILLYLAIPAIVFFYNLIINYYCFNYLVIINSLHCLLTKQSELSVTSLINPSETKRSTVTSGTIQNIGRGEHIHFFEWLVGVTDGDGTFYFARTKKGNWTFTYKIGQSNYNLRLLYYIKANLGVGSVSVPNSKDNTAEFLR